MNQNLTVRDHLQMEVAKSVDRVNALLPNGDPFKQFIIGMMMPQEGRDPSIEGVRDTLDQRMVTTNAIAKAFRQNTRARQFATLRSLEKSGAISKAQLDVGTLTNLASVTGGQSLGYVSLDTQMARGTVRPNSFTIYQCLHKSGAYQVVDYWPYASDTGGGLPGTAFQGYGNVASGTLVTSAGQYNLNFVNLTLAVNGRAITTALAAQNSFVDITAQENINAALTVLTSVNWSIYWGNPTFFPNQFNGIAPQIPAANVFNFQTFNNTVGAANTWTSSQALFNLIYEASAQVTNYRTFGRITHAFMSPTVAGSLQSLVTHILNNIVSQITPSQERLSGVVVDGDLQGMRTRFGEIQFPIDLFISAREKPAQAILFDNGTNYATTSNPARPTSLVATVSGLNANSQFTSAYVASSGVFSYAVASCDAAMNESTLTYLASGAGAAGVLAVSGIAVSGAVSLVITPSETTDQAFRVYRSGLGYAPTSSGVANPASYRHIGTVLANAGSAVTFVDLNAKVPGSESIFLLDMDDNDYAIDFRYLLPLTKIELFAQNLYMPWAVCMIGALRLRIPKFHGIINNFVPDNPVFNPLSPNPAAT